MVFIGSNWMYDPTQRDSRFVPFDMPSVSTVDFKKIPTSRSKASFHPRAQLTTRRQPRNTVISAYSELEGDGFVYTVQGKGYYIAAASASAPQVVTTIDWLSHINGYALQAYHVTTGRWHAQRPSLGTRPARISVLMISPVSYTIFAFSRAWFSLSMFDTFSCLPLF
jgi:hypothetical protein